MVDLNLIATGIQSLKSLVELFKTGRELVTESQRETFDKTVAQTEKQLKLAEAEVATGLGYLLCKMHWPPEIMLETGQTNNYNVPISKCPRCGDTQPKPSKPLPPRLPSESGDWMAS